MEYVSSVTCMHVMLKILTLYILPKTPLYIVRSPSRRSRLMVGDSSLLSHELLLALDWMGICTEPCQSMTTQSSVAANVNLVANAVVAMFPIRVLVSMNAVSVGWKLLLLAWKVASSMFSDRDAQSGLPL